MRKVILLDDIVPKIKNGIYFMKRCLLFNSAALILPSIAFAAVPMTDNELTDNFLKNDIIISDVEYAQVPLKTTIIRRAEESVKFQSDDKIRVEKVFIDPVKINSNTNTTDTLDNRTRKETIFNNNILGFFSILSDNYLNDNTLSSYRFDGKGLSVSYDLSNINNISYRDAIGNYEINNISGIVEIIVEPFSSDNRSNNFRRSTYVF